MLAVIIFVTGANFIFSTFNPLPKHAALGALGWFLVCLGFYYKLGQKPKKVDSDDK